MPCYSGPSIEDERRQQELNDVMTRLACDHCRGIEFAGGTVPSWATEWWLMHKKIDEQREKEFAKAKRAAWIREQALAKLTKEERKALGV